MLLFVHESRSERHAELTVGHGSEGASSVDFEFFRLGR